MTETVLFILEIIGTAVFAASGALAGLQRQLDAFGVVILGVCTACGRSEERRVGKECLA